MWTPRARLPEELVPESSALSGLVDRGPLSAPAAEGRSRSERGIPRAGGICARTRVGPGRPHLLRRLRGDSLSCLQHPPLERGLRLDPLLQFDVLRQQLGTNDAPLTHAGHEVDFGGTERQQAGQRFPAFIAKGLRPGSILARSTEASRKSFPCIAAYTTVAARRRSKSIFLFVSRWWVS